MRQRAAPLLTYRSFFSARTSRAEFLAVFSALDGGFAGFPTGKGLPHESYRESYREVRAACPSVATLPPFSWRERLARCTADGFAPHYARTHARARARTGRVAAR